jgi:hypothetical protein
MRLVSPSIHSEKLKIMNLPHEFLRNIDLSLNKQENKTACVLLWIRTFDHGVLGLID